METVGTKIRHSRRESDRQVEGVKKLEMQSHYPGCWHVHHECALAEIERLQKIILRRTTTETSPPPKA